MKNTPLDQAHRAMEASEDDTLRLQFFDRLASAELFFLLDGPAQGDQIKPRLFPVEDAKVALVFDTEERLSELAGAAPYAAMTGRQLVRLLAGNDLGLGLNLGVAPSSFLLDSAGLDWLAETLSHRPETVEAAPEEVFAPASLPDALLSSLDTKLATCGGLARSAYLSGVRYEGGASSHILTFIDAVPGAESALAEATGEALTFSGIEAGFLDVLFLASSDPTSARIATCALRFDIPETTAQSTPMTPGSDPDNPPRLR